MRDRLLSKRDMAYKMFVILTDKFLLSQNKQKLSNAAMVTEMSNVLEMQG